MKTIRQQVQFSLLLRKSVFTVIELGIITNLNTRTDRE